MCTKYYYIYIYTHTYTYTYTYTYIYIYTYTCITYVYISPLLLAVFYSTSEDYVKKMSGYGQFFIVSIRKISKRGSRILYPNNY